jgi:D-alanine-D-alanine ligase
MDEYTPEAVEERLGYPVFVKPNRGGSSIGIQMAIDIASFGSQGSFPLGSIVVEQYIAGDELTCAIVAPVAVIRSANWQFSGRACV